MSQLAKTILIVLLIFMLLGAAPFWGWSGGFGWGPSGGLAALLAVVIVLALIGKL